MEAPINDIDNAIKINKLIDLEVVKTGEIGNATGPQIDELAQRFEQFQNMYAKEDIPNEAVRSKIESILGIGSRDNQPNRTKLIVNGFITALYLRTMYPRTFSGLVEYGSTVNPNKTPGKYSDVDIALVLNSDISSTADIPISDLGIVNEATEFAEALFGRKVEFSVIWGSDLVTPARKERVTESHKNIDIHSIPIILGKKERTAFKTVFAEQLTKPQTDFRPDLISAMAHWSEDKFWKKQ